MHVIQASLKVRGGQYSREKFIKNLKFHKFFTFYFQNKNIGFRAGIHKTLIRIANMEDPDQTASLEGSLIRVSLFV